jgi:hypothetical protein
MMTAGRQKQLHVKKEHYFGLWMKLIAVSALLINFLVLVFVTNSYVWVIPPQSQHRDNFRSRHKYALANFVDDGEDQIYGVYSIHRQLIKFNMLLSSPGEGSEEKLTHVVLVDREFDPTRRDVLASWVGEKNVRVVNKMDVPGKLKPEQNMWVGTFNKLFFFNLTEFDKIIMMDTDVLIRTNIMHWFDHDTPCGVDTNVFSWNSGTLLISPDADVFKAMLHDLTLTQRFETADSYERDPLSNGYSDQDFVTNFFVRNASNKTKSKRYHRCILPPEAAPLSVELEYNYFFQYYNRFHPDTYETVHFATNKPWRDVGRMASSPFMCALMKEWNQSMNGIDQYYSRGLPPLDRNFSLCS